MKKDKWRTPPGAKKKQAGHAERTRANATVRTPDVAERNRAVPDYLAGADPFPVEGQGYRRHKT